MTTIYEVTDDKDLIKEIKTTEKIVDLKKLQIEIDELQTQIDTMEDVMIVPSGKEFNIIELNEKKEFINELKKVK